MDGNLVLEHEPEWSVMAHLLPEIFDARIRETTSIPLGTAVMGTEAASTKELEHS